MVTGTRLVTRESTHWDGSAWNQLGSDIDGEAAEDWLGGFGFTKQ